MLKCNIIRTVSSLSEQLSQRISNVNIPLDYSQSRYISLIKKANNEILIDIKPEELINKYDIS